MDAEDLACVSFLFPCTLADITNKPQRAFLLNPNWVLGFAIKWGWGSSLTSASEPEARSESPSQGAVIGLMKERGQGEVNS